MNNKSHSVNNSAENKNVSRLVKAFRGMQEGLQPYSDVPKGMFGRVAIIKSGGVTINSEELDVEFTTKFDDDFEANEAEIIVYNLSKTTREAFKYGNAITIEAGYKNDTGVIFDGKVVKVTTKKDGNDLKTTIKAFDFMSGTGEDVTDLTFKAGTKASYILKNLLERTSNLPIAVFSVRRDHTYKEETKISGDVSEHIKKYAEVCGISVYVNNGKVYARHISEGDNINFNVSEETGLIDSPEEFEEEIQAEDYKDVVKGYKFKMLLHHQLTTAAIINLTSNYVNGKFRVRSGTHTFNESEAVTEVEVI